MSKAHVKDLRRVELITPPFNSPIPLATPRSSSTSDVTATFATALPMAAMFTRQKMLGWAAVLFSVQAYLNEPAEKDLVGRDAAKEAAKQPAVFGVGMSLLSLFVTYMPLFFPPPPGQPKATA